MIRGNIIFLVGLLALPFSSVLKGEEGNLPLLLQFTDDPAHAMQLPILRENGTDGVQREIRAWIGFGVMQPESMIRFMIDNEGNLKAESYLYYGSDWKTDPDEELKEAYEAIVADCKVIGVYGKDEACRVKKLDKNLYRKVFRKIESLGVWTLADDDDVPASDNELTVLDGIAMVIEMRDGPFYRAYSWSNPGFRKAPEALRASRIMAELLKI